MHVPLTPQEWNELVTLLDRASKQVLDDDEAGAPHARGDWHLFESACALAHRYVLRAMKDGYDPDERRELKAVSE